MLWLALLSRQGAVPRQRANELGGRTLSLGLVPYVDDAPRTLGTQGRGASGGEDASLITYEMPVVQNAAPGAPSEARYQLRPSRSADNVLTAPGTVEITLPRSEEVVTWTGLDPLEAGVGNFPPAIEDSALADRVLTWVRVVPSSAARARFLWAGINVTAVQQRIAVRNELLGDGDGKPDQAFKLSRGGVVPGSVRIDVIQSGVAQSWTAIDDLMAAGSEVRAQNPERAPGTGVDR